MQYTARTALCILACYLHLFLKVLASRNNSDFVVSCPMHTQMAVQSLGIRSMQPLSEHIASATDFVAWIYPRAPRGSKRCSSRTAVRFTPGSALSIPGSNGTTVKYGRGFLNITAGGQTSQIHMPLDATVEACRADQVYMVEVVSSQGEVLSELMFNAQTGCLGANTLQVASIMGGPSADPTSDTGFASQAGIPLPANYTPPATTSVAPAINPNPCLGQDAGFTTGLATAFYAGNGLASSDMLDPTGPPTFQRCDCPNHKAVNASWPGAPALPAGAFLDNYRVRMAGQFLVTRPEDGVLGETAALFPAASDYHLLCLQHDDSAEMIVDGASYYSGDAAAPAAAGFKQYCAPAPLAPGWHGLELRYGKSPLDATSVFRFFVVDAAEVQTVYTGGVPANQILWKGQGKCCTGASNAPGCMEPLDCCRFRNTGCSSGLSAPVAAPAPAPERASPLLAPVAAPAPSPPVNPLPAPAIAAPLAAPLPAPLAAPIAAHALAPMAAPVAAPALARTAAPIAMPVMAPMAAPLMAPLAAPTAAPVAAAPTLPPAAAPAPVPAAAVAAAPPLPPVLAPNSAASIAYAKAHPSAVMDYYITKTHPVSLTPAPAPAPLHSCEPYCRIYAVDMAFCGGEGLVTAKNNASFIMICQQSVAICGDCFEMMGPGNSTVTFFNYGGNSTLTYQLLLSWDPSYQGLITLDLIPATRASAACAQAELPSRYVQDCPAVSPVSFMVTASVPVTAVAYKILTL